MGQGKLGGLQVARAVAALGIAYFHSWHVTMPFPQGTAYPIPLLRDYGWVSVDFFFAISGFVICLVVTKPGFNPVPFLIRRAFRLYPLWIATSFAYLYLTRYLGREPRQTMDFFAYSLTLLPTEGFPFYDLGWSLQHEMAFYVLASVATPLGGILLLGGALVAGAIADRYVELPWYLHQFFGYYPNFLVGVLAYLAHRRAWLLGAIIPLLCSVVAFYFVISVFNLSRVYFAIPLFFLLIGFLNMKSDRTRVGELLGDASYSIYLIHPLVFYWVYINLQPPLPPVWSQEMIRFGALGVVCLISIVSWKLFESSMLSLGENVARRFKFNYCEQNSVMNTTPVDPLPPAAFDAPFVEAPEPPPP